LWRRPTAAWIAISGNYTAPRISKTILHQEYQFKIPQEKCKFKSNSNKDVGPTKVRVFYTLLLFFLSRSARLLFARFFGAQLLLLFACRFSFIKPASARLQKKKSRKICFVRQSVRHFFVFFPFFPRVLCGSLCCFLLSLRLRDV